MAKGNPSGRMVLEGGQCRWRPAHRGKKCAIMAWVLHGEHPIMMESTQSGKRALLRRESIHQKGEHPHQDGEHPHQDGEHPIRRESTQSGEHPIGRRASNHEGDHPIRMESTQSGWRALLRRENTHQQGEH